MQYTVAVSIVDCISAELADRLYDTYIHVIITIK
jgi:hypothetical protein